MKIRKLEYEYRNTTTMTKKKIFHINFIFNRNEIKDRGKYEKYKVISIIKLMISRSLKRH